MGGGGCTRSAGGRLIRTEVIWTADAEDDDDLRCPKCPANLLPGPRGASRRRRSKGTAIAVLVLTLAMFLTSRRSLGAISVHTISSLGADDAAMATSRGTNGGTAGGQAPGSRAPVDPAAWRLAPRIPLPPALERNLADVEDPLRPDASYYGSLDVPFLFHVPRTMGQTTKDILGNCVGLNLTASLNMNASWVEHIYRARVEGEVRDGRAVAVFTQHLHAGATLFEDGRYGKRGRMFAFVRHPIERAVSMFHYLATATHEPTYDPDLAHVSIEMWSRSKRVEHNWMTRFLSGEIRGDLSEKHLEMSKEILRRKCIVGLFDEKAESWNRLIRFFGWKFPNDQSRECLDRHLNWGWSNKNKHPTIEEGSEAWMNLWKHNELDVQLYEYARALFEDQGALFGEGGRLVKKR